MNEINYNDIKVLFLDVGNTLMSLDYELVCKELEKNDIFCDSSVLYRADAAARPIISSEVFNRKELLTAYTKEPRLPLTASLCARIRYE